MDDTKWERWGLHGGLLGVAALVATIATLGAPPDSDAPAAEIVDWYADNEGAIQTSTVLVAVAVIGLAWWFGSLWRYMRRAEGGEARLPLIAAIGIVLSAAMAMFGFALNSTLAMRLDDVNPDTARFLFSMYNTTLGMSTVADVILVVAVSALAIRSGFLPKWLAYGGAVVAVVQLVGALTIATDNAAIALVGFIAFLTWLAWIAATSLVLYERKSEHTETLDLRTGRAAAAPVDSPVTHVDRG